MIYFCDVLHFFNFSTDDIAKLYLLLVKYFCVSDPPFKKKALNIT